MQETLVWNKQPTPVFLGFPCGSAGKESTCNVGDLGQIPGVGKIPWRRERLPTPAFWPREFHGIYSLWGGKELDMTEQLSLTHSIAAVSTMSPQNNFQMNRRASLPKFWSFQQTLQLSCWPKLLHLPISKPIIGRDKWACHGLLRQPIGLSHETWLDASFSEKNIISYVSKIGLLKGRRKTYGCRKRKHRYVPQKLNMSAIFQMKNIVKF